jgi:hypothetical protein
MVCSFLGCPPNTCPQEASRSQWEFNWCLMPYGFSNRILCRTLWRLGGKGTHFLKWVPSCPLRATIAFWSSLQVYSHPSPPASVQTVLRDFICPWPVRLEKVILKTFFLSSFGKFPRDQRKTLCWKGENSHGRITILLSTSGQILPQREYRDFKDTLSFFLWQISHGSKKNLIWEG